MIGEIIEKVNLHKQRAKYAFVNIENILNKIIEYKNNKGLK